MVHLHDLVDRTRINVYFISLVKYTFQPTFSCWVAWGDRAVQLRLFSPYNNRKSAVAPHHYTQLPVLGMSGFGHS